MIVRTVNRLEVVCNITKSKPDGYGDMHRSETTTNLAHDALNIFKYFSQMFHDIDIQLFRIELPHKWNRVSWRVLLYKDRIIVFF